MILSSSIKNVKLDSCKPTHPAQYPVRRSLPSCKPVDTRPATVNGGLPIISFVSFADVARIDGTKLFSFLIEFTV